VILRKKINYKKLKIYVMKKINFILFVFAVLCLASCSNKNEPVNPKAGNLSSVIESDPELLVNGQWVEFEIEDTTTPTPGYTSKEVFWYVDDNMQFSDFYSQDGNEYKLEIRLNTTSDVVKVRVEIVYYYTSGEVKAYKEQTFPVIQPDIHQFLWGDSKDFVEDNIALAPVETDTSLFYPQIKSEYWLVSSTSNVMAMYEFDSKEKLIKLTEALSEVLNDESDNSYNKVAMRYVNAYEQLSRSFGMNPTVASWLQQPTDEQLSAVEEFLDKRQSSSKETKVIIGKALVNGQLYLMAYSNDSTNTHVKLTSGAGKPGSVDFMMIFTPKN
jgi:hypothetical protein